MAIGGHSVQRIKHRRLGIGDSTEDEVSLGPRHCLYSVERRRQQDGDSHDDSEQRYEAAALGRAPQNPEDPVVDDRAAEYVNDYSEQNQR